MAIAGFVMLKGSSPRSSVRRRLTCFEAFKLNLLSASLLVVNLLMANLRIERGWNSTLLVSVTSSTHKTGKEVRRE